MKENDPGFDDPSSAATLPRPPWNKGKLTGPKPPLRPGHVWLIRAKLQLERRTRDLALFNLAVDSKLRGCDLVALRVDDVAPNSYALDRANVRQGKTGRPVRFELSEQTRQSLDDYLRVGNRKPGQCLFLGRRGPDQPLTTPQYARLVSERLSGIGLDPLKYAAHSMRRTKATMIYRRTGNLRAVQLLLGHSKIESTVRYLGVEIDDALDIAEKIDVRTTWAELPRSARRLTGEGEP
jgi:integrase